MNHWIIRFSLNTSFIFIIGSSITYNNVLGNSRLKSKLPRVEVSETVGNSTISISYSQPTVNWKKTWGKRVPFKKNWTIGDKEKTLITFEEDVKINNIRLGAGTYGFYVYPVNNNDWQIIFSKDINGTVDQYDKVDDMLRVSVVPQEASLQKDLKMGVENIEEEIDNNSDDPGNLSGSIFENKPSIANFFLHWDVKRINLKLVLTGERRGYSGNPLNPNIPQKYVKAWKVVKASLLSLLTEDFIKHTENFSDDFLTNYGDGGGKVAYIQFLGHSYRSGDSEGITINIEEMTAEITENKILFNDILVYFQHGAINYTYELIKKQDLWLVHKIRVPSREGGEI